MQCDDESDELPVEDVSRVVRLADHGVLEKGNSDGQISKSNCRVLSDGPQKTGFINPE